jgi:arsenate reductase (thioredoxin)
VTDPGRPIRVLFLCVQNSARSIMAEAALRRHGGREFEAHSAGITATEVNPLTRRVLDEAGLPTEGLSSKAVAGYLGQEFDYVVTVCDPARQSCPYFPGSHQTLHWDYEDPAAAEGTDDERLEVFRHIYGAIDERVADFVAGVRRGQPQPA